MSDISIVVGDIVNDGNQYRVVTADSRYGLKLGSNIARAFELLLENEGERVSYDTIAKAIGIEHGTVPSLLVEMATRVDESTTHTLMRNGKGEGYASFYAI